MSAAVASRHRAIAATASGALIGLLGGLIGLGGGEFRLPVLVRLLRLPLRRAVRANLAVSLVTVLVAATARLAAGGATTLPSGPGPLVGAMIAGGMVGAYVGSTWLIGSSDRTLRLGVQSLLAAIGGVLIVEALMPWDSANLIPGVWTRTAAGTLVGFAIGAIASVLGVAGGELIIPTLALLFGVPIHAAGTTSLLISVPFIVVGLWRQTAAAHPEAGHHTAALVSLMSVGSVAGAAGGGVLAAYAPGQTLKVFLGLLLLWSAVRLGNE